MDISIILILVAINGVFALSEMAIVSSRNARLHQFEDEGRPGAAAALALHREPGRFLSTIQVGITSVGVMSGALGEATIAEPLEAVLRGLPALASQAQNLSLAVAIILITYLSVVVGELVPKRLALLAPERIALAIAPPMTVLARLANPVVWLLSRSCDAVLALLPGRPTRGPPVSDEEIAVLMGQGAEAGVFHAAEQQMVENVLRLDEQRVTSIMTPRQQFYGLDLQQSEAELRAELAGVPFTRLVVFQGEDDVVGIVEVTALLRDAVQGRPLDLAAHLLQPLRVSETATTTSLLKVFREERVHFALVTNEYGEVEGLVTDTDLLESIVGDISAGVAAATPGMQRRDDHSWLVDGSLDVDTLQATLDLPGLPGRDAHEFTTVAGFVLSRLERIPVETDSFEWHGLRFEVIDMDGRRIDKVLVRRV